MSPQSYIRLLVSAMDFEWAEAKRQANILKHRIDFVGVIRIFAGEFIETEDRRREYGERRLIVSGVSGEVLRIVSPNAAGADAS